MRLFSKKVKLLATMGVSLLSVFVAAVATLTWFQMTSQPLQTSMVSGSSDVSISKVTGHKINPKMTSRGFMDYTNSTVTSVDAEQGTYGTQHNLNKEEDDSNFDIPNGGIGYYLVRPNAETGSYKFSSGASYSKFTEYSTGSLSYITNLSFNAGDNFRVRSYQMDGSKTDLSDVAVTSVTYNGAVDADCLSNGDVVIPASGSYKVWYDTSAKKIGLEYLAPLALSANIGGPKNLYGTVTVYFNMSNVTWWTNDGRVAWMYVWNSTTNSSLKMTRINNTNYWKYDNIDVSTYPNVIFTRGTADNITWDNQTENLTFPTEAFDSNNCFKPNDGSGKLSGSWEKYGDATFNFSASTPTSGSKTLNWSGSDNAFVASLDVKTGETLSVTLNGKSYNYSVDSAGSNNLTSSKTIKTGGSVNVYVHKDSSVYVSDGYAIGCGTSYAGTTFTEMYTNPGKSGEVYATISVTEGQNIFIQHNGANFDTNWSASTASYNNINSSKVVQKTDSAASCYLDLSAKTLWVEGNKTYELVTGGNTYTMSYQSSGDFSGWYKCSGVALATAGTGQINLNGEKTTAVKYTTLLDNSVVSISSNTITWPTTGISSTGIEVYYNTTSHYVYATPIYTITIGSTTKQAFLGSSNIYTTSTNFTMKANDSISAKLNGSTYSVSRMDDASASDRNNIATTSLNVMYDATDKAYINTSSNKIWVYGYAPVYYYSINNGTSWTQMTYNAATSTSKVTATIASGLTAGTTIKFRKSSAYIAYNSSVTADNNAFNNLQGSAGSLTVATTLTASTTLTLNFDNNTAYLGGKTLTYYWYNGDPGLAATQSYNAYLWDGTNAATIKNAAYPGQTGSQSTMSFTNSGTDKRLWTLTFNADTGYKSVIFNFGSSTTTVAYQTFDIDLTTVTNGYYCHVSNDSGYPGKADTSDSSRLKWTVEWFGNPPSFDSDYTFYIHDSGNSNFTSAVYAYAYDSNYYYMHANGTIFPGIQTTPIIAGSLFKYTVADEYDTMVFSNGSTSHKTDNISINNENNGKVWIATGSSGAIVNGGWGTTKTTSIGAAKIYKSTDNGESWDDGTSMFDGDLTINTFMYEKGLSFSDGDYIKVVVSPTGSSSVTYDSYSALTGSKAGLKATGFDKIEVELGDGANAKFNFYVTANGYLAIAMVPDLGNGFYIIPNVTNQDGYVGAKKMNSASTSSAVYSGYYATVGEEFYVRSYIDAVDTLYYVNAAASTGIEVITRTIDGVSKNVAFRFTSTNYYDIEVSNGVVVISEFEFDDFFKLNSLDMNLAASQNAIKNQKTSLVLEVAFKTSSNSFQMAAGVKVTNALSTYIGASVFVSNKQINETNKADFNNISNPYDYMRAYKYSLDNEHTYLEDSTFRTNKNDSTSMYYAYILIDYKYSASLSDMPINTGNSNIAFVLKTRQV